MSQAQREHQRTPMDGRLHAVLRHRSADAVVALMNLSRGGAALLAYAPLGAVPERAELRLRRSAGAWITLPCELRYVLGENRPAGEPSWLHGVRFVEPCAGIQTLVDAIAEDPVA